LLSGGGSPARCVLLVSLRSCVDSEAWGCDLVLCMRVTGLGALCAFWMCILGELGLLLSVGDENDFLTNRMFVVVCDAQG